MKLNELSDKSGSRTDRMRVGRGPGSGKGRTAGRGMKGQKSRSGVSLKGFEGGQMPLYRRLPKRGFKNPFRKVYAVINTGRLQQAIDAKRIDPKKTIDTAALIASGLVNRRIGAGVRLLAKGEIKTKITIDIAGASKAAVGAVEKAGGTVVLPPPVPEKPKIDRKAKAARKKSAKAGEEAAKEKAPKDEAAPAQDKAPKQETGEAAEPTPDKDEKD